MITDRNLQQVQKKILHLYTTNDIKIFRFSHWHAAEHHSSCRKKSLSCLSTPSEYKLREFQTPGRLKKHMEVEGQNDTGSLSILCTLKGTLFSPPSRGIKFNRENEHKTFRQAVRTYPGPQPEMVNFVKTKF